MILEKFSIFCNKRVRLFDHGCRKEEEPKGKNIQARGDKLII